MRIGKVSGLLIKKSKNIFMLFELVKKLENIKIIKISNNTVAFAKKADKKILNFLLFTFVNLEK
jgi:hypothetical protein